jgi:leader peptidase (prepilin peptidase)/N-methyltransferase
VPALIAALAGLLSGPLVHHVAVQAGADEPFAPARAVCRRCGEHHGNMLATCPSCGLSPLRPLLTSVANAAVWAGVAWRLGWEWALVAYLFFSGMTVALFLTDLDHKRIPNRITYPGTLIAFGLLAAGSAGDGTAAALPRALAGAGVYAGILFVVYLVARGGFGFGDVKLAVPLGLFLVFDAWGRLFVAGLVTAVIGAVIALGAVVLGRAGAKTEIPYGPSMILGAWVALIGGGALTRVFM